MESQAKDLYNQGMKFYPKGKYMEALKCFNEAIVFDEKYEDAWLYKGSCEYQLNQKKQALESWKQAILLDPKNKRALNNQGIALDDLGQYQEALECYNKVIQLDDKYIDAWNGKGIALNNLRQYQEALECFKKAIQLDDKYFKAWNNKGIVLKNLGQYQEALECYNKAIQLDDKLHQAWNGKGNILENFGQYQEALECYNKAIQLDDKYIDAWGNKGIVLDNLRQYQEALECYNKVIQLDDQYINAWNGKGIVLDNLRQYQEALECFKKAIQLDDKYFKAWGNKGIVLKNLRQYQEALECFKKAIQLDDKYFKAWGNKGIVLDNLRQYQEALECYNKAIQLDDKLHQAWNGKGNILENFGQYQEALECYARAISIQPNEIYYFNQEALLEKMNCELEAIQSYKKSLKLNPNEQNIKKQQALEIKQSLQKEEQKAQQEIAEKFIAKLNEDKTFQWAGKFTNIQVYNMKEICSYYSHIQPFIISPNEALNIKIEKYNVKKGGFANIHFGTFRDEKIVIKEQQYKQNDYYGLLISMLREISILLYCDHPNISKIMGVYFNPDPQSLKLWIIQDRYYIDLFEALQDQQIIPKKKQLAIQVLEALAYIHSIGLIHLDLKPNNLIFKTQKLKRLLLLDFGISKLYKQNHSTDIQALNCTYSSPEVSLAGKSTVTPKSDVFSFGIVLYEFLTEKRVWKNYIGKGPFQIYTLIQSNFDFFQENDKTGNDELDNLILDCVQSDPAKRPSAQEALNRIKVIQF